MVSKSMKQQRKKEKQRQDQEASNSKASKGEGPWNPISVDSTIALSRAICRILRHTGENYASLDMAEDGYCSVRKLLRLNVKTMAGLYLRSHTVDEVLDIVDKDLKQRFSIKCEDGEYFIRANQGHSIKSVRDEELLTEIESADEIQVCVHGTFKVNLPSIRSKGLSRMTRNHVHFATGLPGENGVLSGIRSKCEVLIHLDVEKALHDGMKLFMSDNGVVLTEGFRGVVPPEYFKKIEHRP